MVSLKLLRDGKELTIPVEPGELKDELAGAGSTAEQEGALEGVEIGELTPEVARQPGLPRAVFGVVVNSVAAASPAESAGLR